MRRIVLFVALIAALFGTFWVHEDVYQEESQSQMPLVILWEAKPPSRSRSTTLFEQEGRLATTPIRSLTEPVRTDQFIHPAVVKQPVHSGLQIDSLPTNNRAVSTIVEF
jgi:hypothetical protein